VYSKVFLLLTWFFCFVSGRLIRILPVVASCLEIRFDLASTLVMFTVNEYHRFMNSNHLLLHYMFIRSFVKKLLYLIEVGWLGLADGWFGLAAGGCDGRTDARSLLYCLCGVTGRRVGPSCKWGRVGGGRLFIYSEITILSKYTKVIPDF
jgi:hypothetical protein